MLRGPEEEHFLSFLPLLLIQRRMWQHSMIEITWIHDCPAAGLWGSPSIGPCLSGLVPRVVQSEEMEDLRSEPLLCSEGDCGS